MSKLDEIRSRMGSRDHTWRWNRGETDGYDAVELRGERLLWYHWSHDFEGGGRQREQMQSVSDFLHEGAPMDGVPARVVQAVRARLT